MRELTENLGNRPGTPSDFVATQNPTDLDYRALSNAGLWCIGRLQTDADRERVLDGLAASLSEKDDPQELARTVQRLGNRWFVIRNAHAPGPPILLQPRYALSWMRGPMTRRELRLAREWRDEHQGGGGPVSSRRAKLEGEMAQGREVQSATVGD